MSFAVELVQSPVDQEPMIRTFEMSTDTLQRALVASPRNVISVNHHRLTDAQRTMLVRIGQNRGVVGIMSGQNEANMLVTARMGGRMQTVEVDPEGGVTFVGSTSIGEGTTWRRL